MTVIFRRIAELREEVRRWQVGSAIVGVVPTMGALHDGHLSLARAAKAECDRVIVTIFVNPKQFNNPDDLRKYPRTEQADADLLTPLGVDVIFAPEPAEVYPDGFATSITVGGVSAPLEGAMRPGHFAAVATVVAKLFGMTTADRAYFGQKDWQQLQVVRRLVKDLNMPVTIVGCETLREPDGLAMSSRNMRLSTVARARAPALFAAMMRAGSEVVAGVPAETALARARSEILAAGFDRSEYLELRDAVSLMPVNETAQSARLLAAAWLDGVRLIDNIAV